MRILVLAIAAACVTAIPRAQTVDAFPFEITTLGGQKLTHEAFRESVLLVDFWGTWCGPCVKAVPVLQEMYTKYKHHGLEIVGLTYENGAGPRVEQNVRKFAARHGVTYHLAIGTPQEKRNVAGFSGYPTMLFFRKGLQFDHLKVGFGPDAAAETKAIETWVRDALGLGPLGAEHEPAGGATGDAADDATDLPDDFGDPDAPEPLPDGVIFKPGDHDSGFDFEVEDAEGDKIVFSKLRGKPVVLALTSTWDGEAERCGKFLDALFETSDEGQRYAVLAASLEIKRDHAARVAAIDRFRKQHGLDYRIFPAGLSFQKKIHLFSGMPLFLVFDADGVLVLRESGVSEKTRETVRQKLAELTGS